MKVASQIRRFVSPYILANMYVLRQGARALVVDPHEDAEAFALLAGVREITVLLTHEHSDHTCGVPLLQRDFPNVKIVCSEACAHEVANRRNNRSLVVRLILEVQDLKNGTDTASKYRQPVDSYEIAADETFSGEHSFDWEGISVWMRTTPGHTPGSSCIRLGEDVLFTGDSLLSEMPVITRFPGGNTQDYLQLALPWLQSLPSRLLVHPGHGPVASLPVCLAASAEA